ncbi:MAG TPA: tetratricopeptide repeat protein [bacterium]|mgnify:CR=1 FL=1|nr:tetratricopeptide repeat protein [bacterium]HOY44697.1 tetratricopeptide repeat protein [bacterium]HPG83698.1 tetratricopeptide repeat protein [bacterium]HPM58166.1 tetratricopeptide repeat protein [bacterium]
MKRSVRYLLIIAVLLAALSRTAAQEKRPGDQELRILQQRAQQLEAAGRLDQAGELYSRVARILPPPQNLNAYAGARRCFERSKDLAGWEALIHDLQTRQRALPFQVDLAEIAYLRGDRAEALRTWRAVIDDNPQEEQAYKLTGAVLLKYYLYDEAESLYLRGRKAFKDPQRFFFELVHLYQDQGAFARMTEEYLNYLQKNAGQLGYVQAQLLSAGDEPEAVRQIAGSIEREMKSSADFRLPGCQLLGSLYTQSRDYRLALQCYEELEEAARRKNPAEVGQYYYTFAMAAMSDGALSEARRALEALVQQAGPRSPHRVHAAFALARLLEKEGDYTRALAAYGEFIRSYPDWPETPDLYLRAGDLYLDRFFNLAAADSVYQRLLQRPNLPVSYHLLALQKRAQCAIAGGDLRCAEKFISTLHRETPTGYGRQRQADLMLVQIDLFEGRPGRALNKLEKLIGGAGGAGEAKADTVQNDLLELYLLLRSSRQDSLELVRYGKALWLQRQRSHAAAFDTLAALLAGSRPGALAERARFLQVDLLRTMGRFPEALVISAALAADSSGLAPDFALMTMAGLHEELKEPEKARQLYESFLEKYPESIYIEQVRGHIRRLETRSR